MHCHHYPDGYFFFQWWAMGLINFLKGLRSLCARCSVRVCFFLFLVFFCLFEGILSLSLSLLSLSSLSPSLSLSLFRSRSLLCPIPHGNFSVFLEFFPLSLSFTFRFFSFLFFSFPFFFFFSFESSHPRQEAKGLWYLSLHV